jgi:hypothetical protein
MASNQLSINDTPSNENQLWLLFVSTNSKDRQCDTTSSRKTLLVGLVAVMAETGSDPAIKSITGC